MTCDCYEDSHKKGWYQLTFDEKGKQLVTVILHHKLHWDKLTKGLEFPKFVESNSNAVIMHKIIGNHEKNKLFNLCNISLSRSNTF